MQKSLLSPKLWTVPNTVISFRKNIKWNWMSLFGSLRMQSRYWPITLRQWIYTAFSLQNILVLRPLLIALISGLRLTQIPAAMTRIAIRADRSGRWPQGAMPVPVKGTKYVIATPVSPQQKGSSSVDITPSAAGDSQQGTASDFVGGG
jgi:hypothetical protein